NDGAWKIYYKLYYSTYGGDGKLLVYGGNCNPSSEVIDGFAAPTEPNMQISSQFFDNHIGIDIAGSNGEPVFAVSDGEIIRSQYSESTGYYIIIHVPAGTNQNTSDRYIYYGHLSHDGMAPLGPVTAGQQIAKIGMTV